VTLNETEAAVIPPENSIAPAVVPPETPPPTDTGDEAKPRKGRFQERISELTSARRKAEEETRYWRERAEKAQTAPLSDPPTLAAYDHDVERFTDAQTQWLSERLAKEVVVQQSRVPEAVAQRAVESNDAEYQQVLDENWQGRLAEAKKDPNWEKVALRQDLAVDAPMGEYIKSAERGPELLFHLGSNPAVAAQIAALPMTQKIAALVKVELSLLKPQGKPVSNAPPPPSTVDGDGEGAGEDPERMSPDQWRAWRNKQIRRR
jgi:hypothetical protein